jgi:hypothetical protein
MIDEAQGWLIGSSCGFNLLPLNFELAASGLRTWQLVGSGCGVFRY